MPTTRHRGRRPIQAHAGIRAEIYAPMADGSVVRGLLVRTEQGVPTAMTAAADQLVAALRRRSGGQQVRGLSGRRGACRRVITSIEWLATRQAQTSWRPDPKFARLIQKGFAGLSPRTH